MQPRPLRCTNMYTHAHTCHCVASKAVKRHTRISHYLCLYDDCAVLPYPRVQERPMSLASSAPVVPVQIEKLRIFRTTFWVSLRENYGITRSTAQLPIATGIKQVSNNHYACVDPNRCERGFVGNTIGQANAVSDKVLDLRNCAYKGADLQKKVLSGALMSGADYTGANLQVPISGLLLIGVCTDL